MRENGRELSTKERAVWLRLIRSENVGPATFWRLLAHCGTAEKALQALPDLSKRGGRAKPLKPYPATQAASEIEQADAMGARFLACGEPRFPFRLGAVASPPPLICVRGHDTLMTRNMIAIVGARNASLAGRKIAQTLASDLTAAGFIVVSGLARGIDTAAHNGALEGGTVAVMAGGIDHIYPPENKDLYDAIAQQGCLLSEMPLGFAPQARHFPRRNRLVSGLSLGTVVVEATLKSGSLITARHAVEQNREVFAIPGSPLEPRSKGPNSLIRSGAKLTETAEDVISEIRTILEGPLGEPEQAMLPVPSSHAGSVDETALAEARGIITRLLGPTPISRDEVMRETGLTPNLVSTVLLELELAGRLESQPGQRVSLIG